MFGRDRHEAHAHERVGTGRVDGEKLRVAVQLVGEAHRDAFGAADPVFLHAADLFGPAFELFDVLEELIGVLRDAEVVARDFALFDDGARAPAAPVDYLLVGEYGLVDGVPVDDLGLAVGDALFKHLEEHPLVPAVVFRAARGDFARPVESKTERLHLLFHVVDVVVRPLRGGDLLRDGGVFGRKTEGVPAHRGHDVVALHAVEAVHDVVQGVVAHMTHVELAARIGEHGADVEFGLRFAVRVECVLDGPIDVLGLPTGLDFGFHRLGGVGVAHNAEIP